MTFSLPSFPILSFQQANPGLAGMQSMQDMMGQSLGNQFQQNINQIQPSMLSQELQKAILANKNQELVNQYYEPTAKADIALKQAQVPYLQAQTGLVNAEIPFAQYKFLSPYAAALAKIQSNQTQIDNSFVKLAGTPEGQALIAKHPEFQAAINNAMQRQAFDIQQGTGGLGGNLFGPRNTPNTIDPYNQNQQSQPDNEMRIGITPVNNQQVSTAGNSFPTLPLTQNQINALKRIFPQNQQQPNNVNQPQTNILDEIGNAASNAYLARNLTAQQRNQLVRANTAEQIFQQMDPLMNDVSKFAGYAGKAKQKVSEYAQASGLSNDPTYSNFQIAQHQLGPLLAGELGQALGFRATDKQKEMLKDIANPDLWDKSPQQVLKEYNSLKSSLHQIAPLLSQTPIESRQTLQSFTNQQSQGPQSKVNIPQFGNKQQFQNWYMSLGPNDKAAVRSQLGGR